MHGAGQIGDFERLDDALRLAPAATPELFHKVAECAGQRISLLRQSGKAAPIDRLIEAGAWTEAAVRVIEFASPKWTIRRIAYEHGEWLCSLSRQPNVPPALDEMADAGHQVLALAILRAFVEARLRDTVAVRAAMSVPQVRPAPERLTCCDNFA